MNKLTVLATLAVLAVSAQAQAPVAQSSSNTKPLPAGIQAVGWDNGLGHVTARIGLTQNNAVDLGLGLDINTARDEDVAQFGASGFYLLKLQDWGIVDNYLALGGWLAQGTDFNLTAFAGLQPEITLLDRLIVSVRFGLAMPIAPDFGLQTVGSPISVVEGINFKIIW